MTDAEAPPRTLRAGIVGAGRITANAHLPVLQNVPGLELAWIADRDSARARTLAQAASVEAADSFDKLPADVVLIAIPVPGREPMLRHFSAAGTAVLVEKPFANSAAEQRRLQSLFPPHAIGVGYQRRFYASSLFVAQAKREGWFGRLRRIVHREGSRATRAGASDYQDHPIARGGGITKNLACHGIDLAIRLAGASAIALEEVALELDGETDRRVAARLRLGGGEDAVELDLLVSNLENTANSVRFEFDNAAVTAPVGPSATVRLGGGAESAGLELGVERTGGATTVNQAFYLEWLDFLGGVRSGRESNVAAGTSLPTAEAIDAILAAGGAAGSG